MFYKGEIPFVRMIIPLIAGILFGYNFPNNIFYDSLIPFTAILLAILTFLIFGYRKFSIYRFRWFAGIVSHIIILVAGYCLTINTSGIYNPTHYSIYNSDAFLVEICNEPKISGQISRFEAIVQTAFFKNRISESSGKIIVSVQSDSTKSQILKFGDVLLIPAAYDSIDPPYNPGEFNYKAYLYNHQIYYQTFLSQDQFYLIESEQGNQIMSFALDLRKRLVEKFRQYLPDNSAASFASTLILGYRAELSRELVEAYSKTGTMHVLSVSGMHVGIVFMVLIAVLKFMNKTRSTRLIRAILIISAVWFYALLTGFSSPACRASLMLSFIVLGKALNKQQNTYNLIAISAFFLLLFNPFYLVDTGFQLSYLAVTGLVYFHPKIYQSIYIKNKFLDYIWSYSALSIAAQLATFPFSIYYFHQFPVYFLFSNLFIVLPVALIMYLGIFLMIVPYPTVLAPCGIFLNWLINFTNNILYFIENLPFSSWDGIWVNAFECALICLLILFFSYLICYNHRILLIPIGVITIILSLSFSFNWNNNYHRTQIIFYNLRKNSAIGFISRGRSIIVSNVEHSDKLLAYSILPTLKRMGSSSEMFYDENTDFNGETFAGRKNIYQFASYRIFKWDKKLDTLEFTKSLDVSAVLISGNPNTTIKKIASCLKFDRIIIDATNSDYKIESWIQEAKEIDSQYYVLKKNPALIVNL